jgi:tRNA(Ile)-lysidine synthetase-like protein
MKNLLALSGGPDSVFLALYLKEKGTEFDAFHYIHNMDQDSKPRAEQAFKIAEALGIKLFSDECKESIKNETQARSYRYSSMFQFMKREGYSNLYVAHHRDDQIETILMRLASGSGLLGIKGIDEESSRENINILRPLLSLSFTKKQIMEYLENRNIPYIFDSTNLDNSIRRNSFRNILIPNLEDFNSELLISISKKIPSLSSKLESLFFISPTQIDYEKFKNTSVEIRSLLIDILFRNHQQYQVSLIDFKRQIERCLSQNAKMKISAPGGWYLTLSQPIRTSQKRFEAVSSTYLYLEKVNRFTTA